MSRVFNYEMKKTLRDHIKINLRKQRERYSL